MKVKTRYGPNYIIEYINTMKGMECVKEQKRKVKRAYIEMMMVTPFGRKDASKMSGEESPLVVCSHKIRPTIYEKILITHSSRVSFLFQIKGENTKGKAPYL